MKNLKVTINGKTIRTYAGKTILQVVHENKLDHIPTLCNDPRVEPFGSCYLCVVEMKNNQKLVPACSTKVSDGIDILTQSEKVINSRKTALELLLSNHYADCIAPCTGNCPAGVDAQGYIALISQGLYQQAIKLVKENNPFPLSIGRVCVKECETNCRRHLVDENVNINYLKRYIADLDSQDFWLPPKPKEKKQKVAIIGGGPAGLTCAYYLNLKGYQVTVFEKQPHLGGMLRFGIPEYRLPKKILDTEIQWITRLGIHVNLNCEIGKDNSVEKLFSQGFASVFIAIGAQKGTSLGISQEDQIQGIIKGIDFLRDVQLKGIPSLKGEVVVVGGGNTAIDAARTALRCQADSVQIVYRRSEKEMPAHAEEIKAAREENIKFTFLTNPIAIKNNNGHLKGIECIRMELKAHETDRRPRPVPIPGSEYSIDCDYLISAIGQQIDPLFASQVPTVEFNAKGTVVVDPMTLETSRKGIFAGGDVVSGPWIAISAIAQGKQAAASIDRFLTKEQSSVSKNFLSSKSSFYEIPAHDYDHFPKINGESMPHIPIDQRQKSFAEVELGLKSCQVDNEVKRCLECGCSEYDHCPLRKYADLYHVDIAKYKGEVRKFRVDDRHPFITLDANKCINCGICARICSEILNIAALGFVYRGFQSIMKPAMEKPLLETNCISCGNCIDACPTGAITEKFPFKPIGSLKKTDQTAVCNYCSLGCNINLKVIDENLFYIANTNPVLFTSVNEGYTCLKGRFGYRYWQANDRPLKPWIKDKDKTAEVSWEKAIKSAASNLQQISKKYGPDSIAIMASPLLSNEELYLIQKLARAGLKTNNVSSFSHFFHENELSCLDEAWGVTSSTATFEDINEADLVIAINLNTTDDKLILEQKIRHARKNKTRLVLINSSEIRLSKFADLWIDSKKGSNTVLLNGLIREILEQQSYDQDYTKNHSETFSRVKQMVLPYSPERVAALTGVSSAKYDKLRLWMTKPNTNILFIYNIDANQDRSNNDLKAVANFLTLTGRIQKQGNGLMIVRNYANSQGIMDMGVNPNYLPGLVKFFETKEIERIGHQWGTDLTSIFKPVNVKEKMITGAIKGLVIFGENPLANNEFRPFFKGVEWLLACDQKKTLTVEEANIFFPASHYLEEEGTFTNCEHRIQKSKKIFPVKTKKPNWKIISELLKHFNPDISHTSIHQVSQELKKINRFYTNTPIPSIWKPELSQGVFYTANCQANLLIYNSDINTYPVAKEPILESEAFFYSQIKRKIMV